jgi:hypothetical protein
MGQGALLGEIVVLDLDLPGLLDAADDGLERDLEVAEAPAGLAGRYSRLPSKLATPSGRVLRSRYWMSTGSAFMTPIRTKWGVGPSHSVGDWVSVLPEVAVPWANAAKGRRQRQGWSGACRGPWLWRSRCRRAM